VEVLSQLNHLVVLLLVGFSTANDVDRVPIVFSIEPNGVRALGRKFYERLCRSCSRLFDGACPIVVFRFASTRPKCKNASGVDQNVDEHSQSNHQSPYNKAFAAYQ
jgi:hypothetical protein